MFREVSSVLISFLIIIVTPPAFSGDNNTSYTVPELVDLALKRSELLTASEKSVESAKWSKEQAIAWQNPLISFGAGNKSESGKNGLAYDTGITQPFYFPGKQKLAGDIAAIQEKIASLDRNGTRLFVRYSVIKLAYRYAVASELAKHLEERVSRFKTIRKYLASRPFPSPKKRMEKHIVEMKLVLLMKSLDEIRSGKDIIWARLNLFIDLQKPIAVRAPWFKMGETLEWEGLLTKAEKDNIDLKKQLLVLERTRTETALARKFAYPDFSLSVLYGEERAPEIQRFVGGGITFSIPLLNANRSGVKSLEAAVEAEKARAAYAKRETAQALISSFIEYEIARRNLERFPLASLDDVHVRLADADDSFNKGLIDLVTYGEVESQVYDTHFALLGAQYEYVEKYAALLILQGSEDFAFSASLRKNP